MPESWRSTHKPHLHHHGPRASTSLLQHEGHANYLPDDQLHHARVDRVDEHSIAINADPASFTRN